MQMTPSAPPPGGGVTGVRWVGATSQRPWRGTAEGGGRCRAPMSGPATDVGRRPGPRDTHTGVCVGVCVCVGGPCARRV